MVTRHAALVIAAVAVVACAPPGALATATPSADNAAATSSASATPTVREAPTISPSAPVPSATPANTTVTSDLGYALELPAGWRRAACRGGAYQAVPLLAVDAFTPVPESEEQLSDVGSPDLYVVVRVEDAQGRTPLAWLQQATNAGGPALRSEQATVDGRAGARTVLRDTGDVVAVATSARGWLYGVALEGPPASGQEPRDAPALRDARAIIASLHVLDSAAIAGAPRPTPVPRSRESVADALASGFARHDAAALALVMSPCVQTGLESAGAIAVSRARYVDQLQHSFGAGLVVDVTARPIELGEWGPLIRSVWRQPGVPDRRIDLVMRADGERWSWYLAFIHQP